MKLIIVRFWIAIVFGLVSVGDCTLPSYIEVCHHDNPDLGGCIKHSIEVLRPYLKVGIPELAVPPLEPFTLNNIVIASTSGEGLAGTKLNDITIHGASDFQISSIKPTKTKNGYTFDFDVNLPKLHVDGKYELDTKILTLQLKGNGPFNINLTDYHILCSLKGKKIQKDGATYLNMEKMMCNTELGGAHILLENLFNGDPVLGKATNDVINDNFQSLFTEITPNLRTALIERILAIANQITLKFTYDELFP